MFVAPASRFAERKIATCVRFPRCPIYSAWSSVRIKCWYSGNPASWQGAKMLLLGSCGRVSFIHFNQLPAARAAVFYTAARGAGGYCATPGHSLRPSGDSGLWMADGLGARAHRRASWSLYLIFYCTVLQRVGGEVLCPTAAAPRARGALLRAAKVFDAGGGALYYQPL